MDNGTPSLGDVTFGDVDGDGDLDFVTASSNSNTASVRLNAGAATAQTSPTLTYAARAARELGLYPNPAHDRVQLHLPLDFSTQAVQVSLRNGLGQVVRERTLAPQAAAELLLSGLPMGVYTVQVRSTQGALNQRLVIE
ncbi:T9SS type A sorting domain-containing protein [Hymenobacter crusticola]|uniref:Secretion system C-terminal sorting domain-containing protein n=1 Tax=Hymenobacter crusticola TaxID=1770526 RepID=A0A243W8B7_9BACT|nr:T9SS type A sorting domain-containing protein [Hymenobacter crusticola]OUJ71421.1 hypothetical protein BXP70_21945 [Hymenobacter crusticola]